jgi:hypothetical protein
MVTMASGMSDCLQFNALYAIDEAVATTAVSTSLLAGRRDLVLGGRPLF